MLSCCTKVTDSVLHSYLERKLARPAYEDVKSHLNTCSACWERWNRFRWERAKGTPGYAEFLAYLQEQGEPLQEYLDSSRALIDAWCRNPPQSLKERETFFRNASSYLYNLVIWHESGNRPPYVSAAEPVLRQLHAHVICDFGCGIGSDGLRFLEDGYQVVFCEFDNASSRFLRWRLQQRHVQATWREPADVGQLSDIDTLWTIDVFDHLPDLHVLNPQLERCRIICFESDSQQKAHGRSSFHIYHPPDLLRDLLSAHHFKEIIASDLINIWQKEPDI